MVEKRVIVISLIFLLGVSVLVSAFSFGDLFGTGKAVDDSSDVVWELEDENGFCMASEEIGDFLPLNDTSCFYRSSQECGADESCEWFFLEKGSSEFRKTGEEASSTPVTVEEGWNVLWGFVYPGQMGYSEDLTPKNVKAISFLDPFKKEYVEIMPSIDTEGIREWESNFEDEYIGGYDSKLLLSWVYFNKSGSFKFRILEDGNYPGEIVQTTLLEGWNFVGIIPGFFIDKNRVEQETFRLKDIEGTCEIEEAYFFEGGLDGNWRNVDLTEEILKSKMAKSIVLNVKNDCVLGRSISEKTCEDTEGANKYGVKGNVIIYGAEGNILETNSDSCMTEEERSTWSTLPPEVGTLSETYCNYVEEDENPYEEEGDWGDIKIGIHYDISCPEGTSCLDGACV